MRGNCALCREIEAAERSNLIIALGDLTFRFPNLLEPWTAHIYQPLSDPDAGDSTAPLFSACLRSVTAEPLLPRQSTCTHAEVGQDALYLVTEAPQSAGPSPWHPCYSCHVALWVLSGAVALGGGLQAWLMLCTMFSGFANLNEREHLQDLGQTQIPRKISTSIQAGSQLTHHMWGLQACGATA